MFVDMLEVQRQKKFDLSSVETGIMAGAPCPQELCKNVVSEMNMKDFVVSQHWSQSLCSLGLHGSGQMSETELAKANGAPTKLLGPNSRRVGHGVDLVYIPQR